MISREVTNSPHGVAGVLNPAWLLDPAVENESHLERRFIMVALSCPVVVAIVHQPFTLELHGKNSRYTPDFKVTFTDDDSVIVEVKPEIYVKKHVDRLSSAESQLKTGSLKFLLVTEKHIDANGLSARAMLLMRYGRLQFA